jgi:hypothetical protein
MTPARWRRSPVAEHAAKVGSVPALKRKMATMAASERPSAVGGTEALVEIIR